MIMADQPGEGFVLEPREENPDFLQPWSRAILMFCILCVSFVVLRLWLVLFPDER